MNANQMLAYIVGGYVFIAIAYVLLHLAVMFAIIGVWRQAKRIANAMELNRFTLERIASGVSSHEPWVR